jgi:hypothetical protein
MKIKVKVQYLICSHPLSVSCASYNLCEVGLNAYYCASEVSIKMIRQVLMHDELI